MAVVQSVSSPVVPFVFKAVRKEGDNWVPTGVSYVRSDKFPNAEQDLRQSLRKARKFWRRPFGYINEAGAVVEC